MRDPHVEALYYRVETSETVTYRDPPPIELETDEFRLRLEGDTAKFVMMKHHATVPSARKVVDEFVRTWEVLVGMQHDPGDLEFIYDNADIIDRDPPPDGSKTIRPQSAVSVMSITGDVTLHVTRPKYPDPPQQFSLSSDVKLMYNHYLMYRKGQMPLTTMAYKCVTILEESVGPGKDKRKRAADRYNISKGILDNLAGLKGSELEARKAFSHYTPLTGNEKEWAVNAIKALIRRVGERAYDPKAKLPKLTSSNLKP